MGNHPAIPESGSLAEPRELSAGGFSAWLRLILNAQRNGTGVDVPCGACNACCRSSYFIHIRPDETATLARIPKKLLFKAPFLPQGHVLLGYNQNGCCPLLVDDKCSIYDARPQTCRNYDCRIFPAVGIAAGEADKERINQQIRRWKFSYPTPRDRERQAAAQAAVQFLREQAGSFPPGFIPPNPTQLAIFAIKAYAVFLRENVTFRKTGRVSPAPKIAAAVMKAIENGLKDC